MSLQDKTFTIMRGEDKKHTCWVKREIYDWNGLVDLLGRHKQGPKNGPCYSIATFKEARRQKAEAVQIDFAVLDCDTGEAFEKIEAAVKTKGYAALIASTHSHMGNTTEVGRAGFEKSGLTPEEYLIKDKGMRPDIVEGASIAKTTQKKLKFKHRPCPKFRIIIPLKEPWQASNYKSQHEANEDWAKRIMALAQSLGLDHDSSCKDTSRMYFLPRCRKSALVVSTVLEGKPCDLFAIDVPEDNSLDFNTAKKQGSKVKFKYTDPKTEQTVDLVQWAKEQGETFQIVDVLKEKNPGIFVGYENDHKFHIACPNNEAHTDSNSDTATFVCNPEHASSTGFVICCLHAHCCDLDRLFFVQKMLEDGWITIDDLYSKDQSPPLTYQELCDIAAEFSKDTDPDDIDALLNELIRANLGEIKLHNLLKLIKRKTGVILSVLKEAIREQTHKDTGGVDDIAYRVMKKTLKDYFGDGRFLIRAKDKNFWGYNGKCWQIISDEQIQHYLFKTVEKLEPDEGNFRTHMKYAFDLLIGECATQKDFLHSSDDIPSVINAQNGEVWIDENGKTEFRPHSPESYLTGVLKIEYDPDATCPKFDQALLGIFANSRDPADMARHMEEMMGYSLQPRKFLACFFVWFGEGSNGKTKLTQVLIELLGRGNVHADRIGNLKLNRFIFGYICDKLLFLDDDMSAGEELCDGLIKLLSEGKWITGERKFKDTFEYYSRIIILILCNDYPKMRDLSHGMRRRLKIVPFERRFTEEDRDGTLFPYIIKNELPGVLNRLLAGFQRLVERSDFLEPEDCKDAKAEWLRQANPLTAFLSERCQNNVRARIQLKSLYEAFQHWCQESGIKNIVTKQEFHRNLNKLDYNDAQTDGYSCIMGLELIGSYYPANINRQYK